MHLIICYSYYGKVAQLCAKQRSKARCVELLSITYQLS